MTTTSASTDIETRLATFITDLQYGDLPETAIQTIERAFVDTVGVVVAGTVEGAGKHGVQFVGEGISNEQGESDIAGPDTAASVSEMGLAIGTAGHSLDYDDLSWGMDGHPSVTLVPAILALSSNLDVSGRDAISAYAAGFETECAVAKPISPEHYEQGWHATATFGTFGAVAAAAHLLGLDVKRTRHALNIAASMPSGLKRNFGSMTKPLHAGLTVRSGLTAALLANNGFTADQTAISGDRGFWDLYADGPHDEFSIGTTWHLESDGIHAKAYPCCYFAHTSIAATQSLKREHDLSPEEISTIEVTASQGAADALQHSDPSTGLEAKFSMEHTVASALVHGEVDVSIFESDTLDKDIIERLRSQVSFTVDSDLAYDSHEATIRLETDENVYTERRENPPGTHDNPLSESELREKFLECAQRALSENMARTAYEQVTNLHMTDDLGTVVSSLRL
jgi:2-methylcitrate dehydratase PrpD